MAEFFNVPIECGSHSFNSFNSHDSNHFPRIPTRRRHSPDHGRTPVIDAFCRCFHAPQSFHLHLPHHVCSWSLWSCLLDVLSQSQILTNAQDGNHSEETLRQREYEQRNLND